MTLSNGLITIMSNFPINATKEIKMKEHLDKLRKLLKAEPSFIERLESGHLIKQDYKKIADLSDPNCPKCDDG